MSRRLRGTDPETVRRALENGEPLPGTFGFAGAVDGLADPDGRAGVVDDRAVTTDRRLVRDVLGRMPLYVERTLVEGGAEDGGDVIDADHANDVGLGPLATGNWAFAPDALEDPRPVPAGTAVSRRGVERIWRLPDPGPGDRHCALHRIARAFETSSDAAPSGDVAIAFSGGVDSALVATLLDAPLYVVGFPDAHDVDAARSAAEAMGRRDDLTVVELDHADVERAIPEVARATGRTNAMDVGIALPLYLVAERAAADGFDRLAVGQGADELFGGYEKVARLDDRVEAATVRGAVRKQVRTLPEQLSRDVLAVRTAGIDPVAPFLHDAVIDAALRLPESLLVDGDVRKVGLRRVASDYLPDEVAEREKKAVQYGSLVTRELDRLARQAGYKRRTDAHVRKYVESLLDARDGA